MSHTKPANEAYFSQTTEVTAKMKLQEIYDSKTNYRTMSPYISNIIDFLETEKAALLELYKTKNLEFNLPVEVSVSETGKKVVLSRRDNTFEIDYSGSWNFLVCLQSETDFLEYKSQNVSPEYQKMDWPAPVFDKEEPQVIHNDDSSLLDTITQLPHSKSKNKQLAIPRSRLNKLIIEMYCGNQYAPNELKELFELLQKDSSDVKFVKEIN